MSVFKHVYPILLVHHNHNFDVGKTLLMRDAAASIEKSVKAQELFFVCAHLKVGKTAYYSASL